MQLAERFNLSEPEKSEAVRRLVSQTTTKLERRFKENILLNKRYIEVDQQARAKVATNPEAFEFVGPNLHAREECVLWSTDAFAQKIHPVVGNAPDGARLRAVTGKLFQTKIGRAQAALIRSELEGIRRSYPSSKDSDGTAWEDINFKFRTLPPTERLDGVLACYINKVDFLTGSAKGASARVDESLVVKEIGKSILATGFRADDADITVPSLKRVVNVLAAYPELPAATLRAGLIEGLAQLIVGNNVEVSGSLAWEELFRDKLNWASNHLNTGLKDRQRDIAGIDHAAVNRAVEIAASSQFYIAEQFYNWHRFISEGRDLYDLDVDLGGLDLYFSEPNQFGSEWLDTQLQIQSNLDKIYFILEAGKATGKRNPALEVDRNEVTRNSLVYLLVNKRGPLFGNLWYCKKVIDRIGPDKAFLNSDPTLREAVTHFASDQKPSPSPKLVYQSLGLG